MIDLINGRITWSDRDVRKMSRLLGDKASLCRAPYVASILRWVAVSTKLPMSTAAKTALAREEEIRAAVDANLRHKHVRPSCNAESRFFPHVLSGLHAVRSMLRPYALVADEVGVGKTPIAVRMLERFLDRANAGPALIITPNTAKLQWRAAIKKFGEKPRKTVIVDGTRAEQAAIIESCRNNRIICIAHWESLVHAAGAYLNVRWGAVVADEAQWAYNREAKRTQTLHSLEAAYRMALTAHPYTKGPHELWSILHFLDPQLYSSFWRFFDMHVDYDPKPFGGFEVNGPRRPKLLQWELAPFTIRRTRSEVRATLPKITRVAKYVELSPRGQKELQALKKAFFAELEGEDGAFKIPLVNTLARTTRIRQYLVDPGLVGSSEKPVKHEVVQDILQEVQQPLVIFSAFRQALVRLREGLRIAGCRVGIISGEESLRDREKARVQFIRGKLDAIVVVTSAGREAINLSGFGYIVHLDLPWTPRDLEQTEGRVDRPSEITGQSIPTTAFRLLTMGTYEERMEARLEDRHEQFGRVFTINDLRGLFE